MLILSLLSTASAADMNLDWAGKTVRYHAETLIQHFYPIELLALQNTNVRAVSIMAAADMTCTGEALKKGWALTCTIDTIGLQGVSQHPSDTPQVDAVLEEYSGLLTGAVVQVELAADGRVKVVDLEGVAKADERQREIHEKLRLVMRRMVAPMDQQLPKKGTTELGDSWKQKNNSVAFEIFSKFGTIGGSVLEYEVIADANDEVAVVAGGRGNIGLSNAGSTYGFAEGSAASEGSSGTDSTGYASSSVTPTLYNVVAQTGGRFDASAGQWAYMESTAQGLRNQGVVDDNFTQAAWMGRINADGSIEDAGVLVPTE
ncbi:MAG: hypothetical protein P8R54_29675 [Myxococcota bacterium]|nr:hypothetical protein [Myxococcota bacterium]